MFSPVHGKRYWHLKNRVATQRKYSVEFADIAEQDLVSIAEYIECDDPVAARHVLDKIQAHATKLEKFPDRGRIVPELEALGLMTHREIIIPPWRMLYRIAGHTVYIVAIFDGRRNLEDVLLDRIVRTSDTV